MKKIIIVAVCLIIAALSIYKISGYLLEMLESQNLNDSLTKEAVMKLPQDAESNQSEQESVQETAPIIVDFEVLQTENKDIIAWLHCPDTKINYPVAQSEDNSYYLRRLLDGSWNTAGTIFMYYRNSADFSDRHTVIYGHNMKNDTMFGSLPEYQSQEYYEQHPVWYLLTPEQNYKVELIAAYVTPSDSAVYGFEKTQEERNALLETALKKSAFTTDISVSDEDRLITFSTCSYEYDGARFVLVGVLCEID